MNNSLIKNQDFVQLFSRWRAAYNFALCKFMLLFHKHFNLSEEIATSPFFGSSSSELRSVRQQERFQVFNALTGALPSLFTTLRTTWVGLL
jgi:hypothetical protein